VRGLAERFRDVERFRAMKAEGALRPRTTSPRTSCGWRRRALKGDAVRDLREIA
jgi:hypothetical protein